MGRSFASVRQGVKGPLERWARTVRELGEEDKPFGERVVALARLHSSEAFYGCDEPLEVAILSGLIGILKSQEAQELQARMDQDTEQGGVVHDVDP